MVIKIMKSLHVQITDTYYFLAIRQGEGEDENKPILAIEKS